VSNHKSFRRTAIVVALSAVFPLVSAYADEVDDLINPNVAEVAVKLPYQNNVNPLYRQYNGVNHEGVNGNVDIDIVRRGEDGDWLKIKARELGLSTQEFGASYEKQGDWSVGLEYNQIPRYSPYEINTGVKGVGSNVIVQPSLPNSSFSSGALTNPSLNSVTLSTERDITTLTASKYLMEGLKLGFSFKNEEKTGTRMGGVRGVAGNNGSSGGSANRYSGFLFAPEPIDQNHKQFEGTLEYANSTYQIVAGYYGSFLTNNNTALSVIPGTNTALVASNLSPIGLAPDNSSQQIYVNGAYNFTKDTRGTLKYARSEGRQNESFLIGQATNAGIGSSLDAKVNTTEIFSSLTSRITRDFKLLGSWRYEDKQDKTPIRTFYTGYPNNPESHKANWGKFEADYNIGAGYGVTAGVDYNQKKSDEWERKEVKELTSRIALRKAMSETVNGTVSLAHSERDGSDWGTSQPALYPVYLADRSRNKVRGMVDWATTEALNLQFAYEAYFDQYTRSSYGLDNGQGQVFSLDASYTISDNWKLNGWYSKQIGDSSQHTLGAVCSTGNNSNCTSNTLRTGTLIPWDAKLTSNSDQIGFGLNGKVKALELGAQYLYSRDFNKQSISGIPAMTYTAATVSPTGVVAAGNGALPDTSYVLNSFKAFGVYPIAKTTKLRVDYIFDMRKMDDYTWQNWVYADGTKVYVKPNQTTQILGISLIQSF
jgi:MtrB/PioB family decaheme-associated outer membrane protein